MKTAGGVLRAKGRGIFKKDGITLSVGDVVDVEALADGDAVINSILPRRNHFIRPPIANVDSFVVVCAAKAPKPNFSVIDRFLIMAEMHDMEPIICVNKCDLGKEKDREQIREIYQRVYPVVFVSGKTGQGIETLTPYLQGKRVALAGPSGVGKSTIINSLIPRANMETGAVSEKTARGKHTTRHVEIFESPAGGLIFDTPGFTSFEILEAEEDNLADFYPEIAALKGKCKFDDCRHRREPDCAVREAVQEGRIHPIRYDGYLANLEEIRKRKKY